MNKENNNINNNNGDIALLEILTLTSKEKN